jgi:nitrogen fixation protein NifT
MPSVMIRQEDSGSLSFYIAKKDLETMVSTIEFDEPTRWGGKFELVDGSNYFIDPLPSKPKLPITLRARRAQ